MRRSLASRWVLLVTMGALLALGVATADTFRYEFPENLVLSLEKAPQKQDNQGTTLIGAVEARVGSLKDIDVFFESSEDLLVNSATLKISSLTVRSVRKFKVKLKNSSREAGVGGSWIRMRVTYSPDYAAISNLLANTSQFPDVTERQRLLDILSRNSQDHKKYTSSVRWFPSK